MLVGDLVSYNMLRNEKYAEIQVLVRILNRLRTGDEVESDEEPIQFPWLDQEE